MSSKIVLGTAEGATSVLGQLVDLDSKDLETRLLVSHFPNSKKFAPAAICDASEICNSLSLWMGKFEQDSCKDRLIIAIIARSPLYEMPQEPRTVSEQHSGIARRFVYASIICCQSLVEIALQLAK